ncbi:DNA methyltransferase [Cryobacterium sp. M91]|uniref:DNA methyltransferase n=1 Tax=Cryobacterium sp. M91 TaxID=2048294 RepID=UPI000CE2DD02|nr:DNA methyltransferase [Cryobacterium sp. M91]
MGIATGEQLELSRKVAREFADKWAAVTKEKQLAQSFWSDFFHKVIGVQDLLAAGIEFEHGVKSSVSGLINFIDVFWSGVVMIEHKSAGKDLNVAERQIRGYLASLDAIHRPAILIVSDFARIRIIDHIAGESVEFPLHELPDNLDRLDAIFTAKGKNAAAVEVIADAKASEKMANLYVAFEKNGYEGHEVSVLLIRILFLLFGEDTRMFKSEKLFTHFIEAVDKADNLGGRLQQLFQTLNSKKRPPNGDSALIAFPYVNGGLFAENLQIFSFSEEMRTALLEACAYNWAKISPAIFGAMFQTIKSKEDRRALGEHYTSEANILKVIRPLFLDEYLDRLHRAWDDRSELRKLRKDLGSKNYLDPAAGSGNFLLITYKRLRDIEHKIIARLADLEGKATATDYGFNLQMGLDGTIGLTVRLEQFHAIEYEEWSSQIATVAMFMTDHQANLALEELTGAPPNRFPLSHAAIIHHGNALRVDWAEVCPMNDNTIIMGNPPFYGASLLLPEQKVDQELVWGRVKGAGDLDYVASWYLVAARHMAGTKAKAAFVSTNSITQGQQPPVLWGQLRHLGMNIDFAHRTFEWWNGTANRAAVHCVIIGFSTTPAAIFKPLWSYESVKSDAVLVRARNINAYLLDAKDVLVSARTKPFSPSTQEIVYGSKPTDSGWLSKISPVDAEEIKATDPIASKYLRVIVGATELINNRLRYCLWLMDSTPNDRVMSPVIKARVAAVRAMREASDKDQTRDDATRAWEFQEPRQPSTPYLVVPLHSSENRDYIPMPIFPATVIATNAVSLIPNVTLTTFGFMMSSVFVLWAKAVSGRIKNDPRISNTITYNNFPFPVLNDKDEKALEKAAQAVLDARESWVDTSLATLYNRDAMPTNLRVAHKALDKAVLNAFDLRANATDIAILETLFNRYGLIIDGLLAAVPGKKKRKAKETT